MKWTKYDKMGTRWTERIDILGSKWTYGPNRDKQDGIIPNWTEQDHSRPKWT